MSELYDRMRMVLSAEINAEQAERATLESKYGKVWDTQEMTSEFTVHGFAAPFVSVTRKADGVKGSLTFQHMPRFYFDFVPV